MGANKLQMGLTAIGTIQTPYDTLADCPRNIGQNSNECLVVLFEQYRAGLEGLAPGDAVELLYWLDHADFNDLIQLSRRTGEQKGVFALRSPNRPNPIGSAAVKIDSITEAGLTVRGLDCLSGTPLLDIKPAFRG